MGLFDTLKSVSGIVKAVMPEPGDSDRLTSMLTGIKDMASSVGLKKNTTTEPQIPTPDVPVIDKSDDRTLVICKVVS